METHLIILMGNTLEMCVCRDRKESDIKKTRSNIPKNTFRDGSVNIIDFTGLYQGISNLEKLEYILPEIYPLDIKCFRGIGIESEHSYVKVIGFYLSPDSMHKFQLEIFFNSGNFLVQVRLIENSDQENEEPDIGNIEYVYKFPETTVILI